VSPFYSPATGTVPCAAMWFDARAIGRPIWRAGYLEGHHDGWRACTTAGTELIEVNGHPRLVCTDHARQTRAAVAAGLAGRLAGAPSPGGIP
jgi:hypothetical protein